MKILVGADPEVFVEDTSGKLVCAHDMVKGTKDKPFPVKFGAVQVDGMALEFNIDPASTMEEFVNNIVAVKQTLHEMIGLDKYNLLSQPSVFFDKDVMDAAHPFAKILGCEPDFNAWWDGMVNPSPNGETNMRTGAGHVHVGWDEGLDLQDMEHAMDCIEMVKQLDCSLGIQSLSWDDDSDRRSLYGKAGAYRVKTYGVEYRVLSNAWLRSEELISHVYNVTVKAAEDFFNDIYYSDVIEDANRIIDEGDTALAREISDHMVEEYGVPQLALAHV